MFDMSAFSRPICTFVAGFVEAVLRRRPVDVSTVALGSKKTETLPVFGLQFERLMLNGVRPLVAPAALSAAAPTVGSVTVKLPVPPLPAIVQVCAVMLPAKVMVPSAANVAGAAAERR